MACLRRRPCRQKEFSILTNSQRWEVPTRVEFSAVVKIFPIRIVKVIVLGMGWTLLPGSIFLMIYDGLGPGSSFFKSKIFVRGGTPVQIFFKKLYFDLPIPKRGLPGPHCLPFWSYGAPKFCKIWANPTHSLWRTIFCKMKAVRNCLGKSDT